MKISELIENLKLVKDEQGDLNVSTVEHGHTFNADSHDFICFIESQEPKQELKSLRITV